MPCLLIRHKVQDYSTWKAVFDEQADRSPGQRLPRWTALPLHRVR